MGLWTRVPRGLRDRLTGVLPDWWWAWLHQLREIDVDREWQGAAILRSAYPSLAAPATGVAALRRAEVRVHSQNGEDGILAYLLAVGSHTLTARYSGNSTYSTATSAGLTQTVKAAPNVTLTSSANPSTSALFSSKKTERNRPRLELRTTETLTRRRAEPYAIHDPPRLPSSS